MALIEAKKLEKVYGSEGESTQALNGVSFKIERGEFVAIMGPSGSGKSTLLHILGMLDRPSTGEYCFDGKPIDEYSEEELAKIRNEKMGFVFQAFNLLPKTTVLNNTALPLFYSGIPEDEWMSRAQTAIEAVGLSYRINHESAQLSGGEKQRAAIARALVLGPEVIFADEPTGNLDSKSGEAVIKLLANLNKERGHTVVLITHEDFIAKQAGRLISIKDGKIERDEAL